MAQCLTPYQKRDNIGQNQAFPCGKCPDCLKRRTSGWSFRIKKETQRATSAFFITFTYDTLFVPITKNGFMSLQKSDMQKYFKRLRKFEGKNKIKYYLVGEYGGKTKRPHYHALIFNADINNIEKAYSINNIKLGEIHCGQVTDASSSYTLKYMNKEKTIPQHRNDDRQKEFSIMSKGIGNNYLTKQAKNWHHSDMLNRMYIPLEENKKIAMPKYYKKNIYTDEQRQIIGDYIKNVQIVDNKIDKQEIDLLRIALNNIRKQKSTRLNEII